MPEKYLLEIAAFNVSAAYDAANAGADRIELCENPMEGGTTPSYGTLKIARDTIHIPIYSIIRPRGGDFLYDEASFSAMKQDIALCKSLQMDGVVIGMLLPDGRVDKFRTQQLVELAYPLEVTFHRAFDRTLDPFESLEDIIQCGCNRILTSGQTQLVMDGKNLIKSLIRQAGDRIIIMPGSGVRSNNIQALQDFTGAKEFHSSARISSHSAMKFQVSTMQEHLFYQKVDTEEIFKMKSLLTNPLY